MKKSILFTSALVGLMFATSCSNFNQNDKKTVEVPTVYAEGYDTSFHDEYQGYKDVNTSYTSCKTNKQVPYQKTVKDGVKSFDHSVKAQGQKIDQDAFLAMLASAGFVKETDTWTTLPWNWLQWILFALFLIALVMFAIWLLRRLWHLISTPLPPHPVYYVQQPQFIQPQYVQQTIAPAPAHQPAVAPIVEAPVPAPAPTPVSPVSSGSTIINNYAGGIIFQVSGNNQPAPGFTKKSTSFDINVKGKFDEEWS